MTAFYVLLGALCFGLPAGFFLGVAIKVREDRRRWAERHLSYLPPGHPRRAA